MKQAKVLEKQIKNELKDIFESLGSTRYFVEVNPKGQEFAAKIWIESDILDRIATDQDLIKTVSDAVRYVELKFNATIFEELKPLF